MEATNVSKGNRYPIGFYVSCLTYTFERFAFYGSKPFLILFLITAVNEGGLGINATEAAVIASNFTAFTYIAPVIGGYVCDHWLGSRYAVTIGCILMGIGYMFGWKATGVGSINLMIAIVAIGTGLFKGNLAALMGRLFDDPTKLDSAFSIQYAFVNVGAMFGSAISGFLYLNTWKQGDVLGFRPVFLLCGVLVIIGGIFFTACYGLLQGQGKKPFKYLTDVNGNVIGKEEGESKKEKKNLAPLTKTEKKRVAAIVFISFVSIIFWLFYYQQDIALTIYMSKFVDMKVAGFEFSPGHVTTTWNGLLCVILALAAAKLWTKLSERPQGDLTMFQKVTLAFVFLGLAYLVLIAMETTRGVGAPESAKISVLWLFGFGFVLTLGEICFSPLGNSFVSKYAPKKYLSLLMGVWTIATFFATKINGYTQGFVESLGIYTIFVTFAIVSFVVAAIMFFMNKPLGKLLADEDESESKEA
ncbi:peptide MFS transporter [Peptostreptococcus faecalis]|uniref:peptide MFS transporter n=1 Tax=Peptostreptococcus faecalis TaxID=2045015 RepID=UPI000C7E360A|nr:peptide MFS transporter [Peptostreptococcus faecalis]